MAGLMALVASEANAACYADPKQIAAAVQTIVASFKCPGFKQAIFGDRETRFMSDAGVVDQSTGSCRSEIAAEVEARSVEVLSGEAAYCAKAVLDLDANVILRDAARKVGAY